MSIKLDTLNANETLANLQIIINQTEQLGYQLISFAKGMVASQPANIATFRRLTPGTQPNGTISLVLEANANLLPQQQNDLNAGEFGSKQIICYAIAFTQGNENNIAVYRG